MTVTKRGNRWQAYVTSGDGRWRQLFFRREDAQAWEAELKARLAERLERTRKAEQEQLRPAPTKYSNSLQHLFDNCQARLTTSYKSGKTLAQIAQRCITIIGPSIDTMRLSETHLKTLVEALIKEGCGDATINHYLSAVSTILRLADEDGWAVPQLTMPRQEGRANRFRVLSFEEEKALLGCFTDDSDSGYRDLFSVMLDTGALSKDIMAIQRPDVDLEGRFVTVGKLKGSVLRKVPLNRRALGILARRVSAVPDDATRLFPMSRLEVSRKWASAKKRMGLTTDDLFVPAALRHTFCARLAQGGIGMADIAARAGHQSLAITLRYSYLYPKGLKPEISDDLREFLPEPVQSADGLRRSPAVFSQGSRIEWSG